MKVVERADQYLFYHSIFSKTIKESKEVVLWLINWALFKDFRVSKYQHSDRKLAYKEFLLNTVPVME